MSDMDWDVCIYCHQAGCISGAVVHASDCPQVTNVYPVTDVDRDDVCCDCKTPLADEEFCVQVVDPKHEAMSGAEAFAQAFGANGATLTKCMTCAAMTEVRQ